MKVQERSVQEQVLSKKEIKSLLDDFRNNEEWFYPCYALWLGIRLRMPS